MIHWSLERRRCACTIWLWGLREKKKEEQQQRFFLSSKCGPAAQYAIYLRTINGHRREWRCLAERVCAHVIYNKRNFLIFFIEPSITSYASRLCIRSAVSVGSTSTPSEKPLAYCFICRVFLVLSSDIEMLDMTASKFIAVNRKFAAGISEWISAALRIWEFVRSRAHWLMLRSITIHRARRSVSCTNRMHKSRSLLYGMAIHRSNTIPVKFHAHFGNQHFSACQNWFYPLSLRLVV